MDATNSRREDTVYDRIDAAATINFSTQFGAATIRERSLFESSVYFFRRGYRLKNFSEKVNTCTKIVYYSAPSRLRKWRPRSSPSLLGVRVNIDGQLGSSLAEPASSALLDFALSAPEAGSARLALKMEPYITSNMAELPKMLERRDTSEPMHVLIYMYLFAVIQIRAQIRLAVVTIRERRLFRSVLAQMRLLFESGVYSRVASIRSYTVTSAF